jgi:RND family efflux transporter MFP subunit
MPRSVLVLSALTILLACGHRQKLDPVEPAVPIKVIRPERVNEFQRVSVSGTITPPSASSLVPFLVAGRVLQVLPREGEPVRQGQVLAVLDSANLGHALEGAHSQVEAARASAGQARQEFQRMQQLFDSASLAPNDFAKFKAADEAAQQQLLQAQAAEAVAAKNLRDARLEAPIAGYVARRLVEPGATVAPGQPAFEIARMDPVEVNVGVPETDIPLVKVGQAAAVTVPALPGQTFRGKVNVVNVSSDPATRTYMTRITVANPGHELKVGMVAEVAITGARKLDMLCLPLSAIVRDPQGATQVYQYFPDQGRVYAKRIETGSALGSSVQVRCGLTGDENIVAAGQQALRNGMAAQPVSEVK